MKSKALYLLLVISLLPFISTGQGIVKGYITDAGSGEPLIGATILEEGTTNGITTNVDGSFVLNVTQQKVVLRISYVGYIDLEIPVELKTEEVDLGKIKLNANLVNIDEVLVTASFVRDRITPVAVSTVDPKFIVEKLGNKEFPEILKITPSVYATRTGGGFGDSRIYLRGFDSNNIGVLINGIPVNDMENGKVYWSNWAGLPDVTVNQQVQRGLGASKLALSSVGGTINIITKSTESQKGGSYYSGFGNDGYRKQSFTVSTGLMENGWAVTLSGSYNIGNGYIKGTNYEGYSYFANISKKINDKHTLSFNAFGAPQWHNQRNNKHTIQEFRDHPDGLKWNSDYGYRNGQIYTTAYAYNFYHKPQISLSHYWKINETSMLSTQLYASLATGGGRRAYGANSTWITRQYPSGLPYSNTALTDEGYYDYDYVIAQNAASLNGSTVIIANAVNDHQWYGALSTYTTTFNKIKVTAGFDGRFYNGVHAYKIDDLLGGKYFLDNMNINRPASQPLYKGDYVNYHNLGQVLWIGLFAQGEYVTDKYSGFLSMAIAQNNYRRIDYFQYEPGNRVSPWYDFLPWNVKAGFSYNIYGEHNLFVNGGYIKRAPIFANTFLNYKNDYNEGVKYEQIITTELGYNFASKIFNVKVNLFRTQWLDKGLVRSLSGQTANILGINALHQGVEVEGFVKPFSKLDIRAMFSWGDYVWSDDVNFNLYDETNTLIGTYNAYIKDVHVGNSAQVAAALSCNYEVLPKLKIGADVNWYAKNYADFDPASRTNPNSREDAWRMPNYYTIDLDANYQFKIGNFNATLYGNVNNLLDTEYIADATDGVNHDEFTSYVFFGFGRTWSTGLRINF
ncbi:MAG TPA: TonB-dependent receptor [Bacteroidales bacterium]|nr:TonB-dependent receptor [Bacteroidales bacterium]